MLDKTVEALKKRGFEAVAVATGAEALAAVMEFPRLSLQRARKWSPAIATPISSF